MGRTSEADSFDFDSSSSLASSVDLSEGTADPNLSEETFPLRTNFQTRGFGSEARGALSPPSTTLSGESEARSRSLTYRSQQSGGGGGHRSRLGQHIREVERRPRCGLHLLRSLRNDKQLSVPEPRGNGKGPPRHPGKTDKLFSPKDGDLILHHVKRSGKRVLEFYDPDQPPNLEDGDYLVRFKVENYSFMHQSFVTVRGYMYHHQRWVYLGKDSDQMELV